MLQKIKELFTKETVEIKSFEEVLEHIQEPFRDALVSMYKGEPQVGADGKKHPIDEITKISLSQGTYIYELFLDVKPRNTLEIGMAFGYSTIYILAALSKNQQGSHTAIDPFQNGYWKGIGVTHAKRLSELSDKNVDFTFIEEKSNHAATDLYRARAKFDMIFIDGDHLFEGALTDFHLYAPLCEIGGYIIFDDMWMNSIQTVVSFIRNNRKDFKEIPTKENNISVFQKVDEDKREWKDFHQFKVAGK